MKRPVNKDVPFVTYIIHDKNMKGGRMVTVYKPTQEYYTLFELIKFRRLPATFPDIGITVISEGLEPSNSDVSMTRDVSIDIKTPPSIENTNPDYYKQEIDRLTAENERLSQLLHDEMSQLQIATDLGNKRWLALNDIYENGEKHNSNWCKRKAQEGLSSK